MPTLEERPPEAAAGLAGGFQQGASADPVMPEADDSKVVDAALSLLPDDATGDADPEDTFRALAHFAEDGVMNAAPAGQSRGTKAQRGASEPNAALRVVLYKNNEVVDTWDSLAVWQGDGSASFRATRLNGKWNWDDPAGRSFKVNTGKDGSGGQSVEAWGARGDMILIHMQPIDAVTVDKGAKKSHLPPGHATDELEAGDGSTDRTAPDGEGKTGSTKTSSGSDDASEGGGKKSAKEEAGSGTGGDGGDDSDAVLDEILASEEEIAKDLEARIGIDPDDDDQENDGDGAGVAGGSIDGRTGTDTEVGGTGPGGEGARSDGKGEGSTDKSGGGVNEGGNRDGKDQGSEGGMVGGEGEAGEQGIPMGSPWGQFGVPDSLKGLLDVALIVSSANVLGGGQFFQKGIKKGATALSTRNALAKQARLAAAKRHKKVMAKLKKTKKWKSAKPPQRAAIERKVLWDYQRQYFDDYLETAKRSRAEAKKKLAKSPKNKSAKKQIADADIAIEAATVKPLAGRLPINHEFAGKSFPVGSLPKKYQGKGVKFSDEGFPDFEPHAMPLPNGSKTVPIKMTGSRTADDAAANAALRKVDPSWKQPGKHTWHHLDDGTGMILVPQDLHDAVRHAGGVARYKQETGAAVYGK